MKVIKLSLILGLSTIAPTSAAKKITLSPFQTTSGKTVVIESVSTGKQGVVTIKKQSGTSTGVMNLTRTRRILRKEDLQGNTRRLTYHFEKDHTQSTLKVGESSENVDRNTSLAEQPISGFKDAKGLWRLYLAERTPSNNEAIQIAELEAYENRQWFPKNPVEVGETWKIDPGFIRHIIKRDVGDAKWAATAKLEKIDIIDGIKTAMISMKILSLATSETNGDEAGVGIDATAKLWITLDSMLDRKFILEGTLVTLARNNGQSTKVKLPMKIEVTKKLQ